MKVEPNDYLKLLSPDTVISCGIHSVLYKISTIVDGINSVFNSYWPNHQGRSSGFSCVAAECLKSQNININSNIFQDGIECEILDTKFPEWKKENSVQN